MSALPESVSTWVVEPRSAEWVARAAAPRVQTSIVYVQDGLGADLGAVVNDNALLSQALG